MQFALHYFNQTIVYSNFYIYLSYQ